MFPLASVEVLTGRRYGAGVCLVMNSKNRVKEDLRPVLLAHGGVLSLGQNPPIGG
jgi:hypothetical protein